MVPPQPCLSVHQLSRLRASTVEGQTETSLQLRLPVHQSSLPPVPLGGQEVVPPQPRLPVHQVSPLKASRRPRSGPTPACLPVHQLSPLRALEGQTETCLQLRLPVSQLSPLRTNSGPTSAQSPFSSTVSSKCH